jgi:hypothetical protein
MATMWSSATATSSQSTASREPLARRGASRCRHGTSLRPGGSGRAFVAAPRSGSRCLHPAARGVHVPFQVTGKHLPELACTCFAALHARSREEQLRQPRRVRMRARGSRSDPTVRTTTA